MIIQDKYVYTVTLNGMQAALLTALLGRGLYGRDSADVIRRIIDERLAQMVEEPKINLLALVKSKP